MPVQHAACRTCTLTGDTPAQRPSQSRHVPASDTPLPCIHRGDVVDEINSGCGACRGKPIWSCAMHGRCVATQRQREEVRGSRACDRCGDRVELTDADLDRMLGTVAVVTCHFNPVGYRRPVANYERFIEAFPADVRRFLTVELSFDGRTLPIDNRSERIHIAGDPSRHLMWQKEALLNVGFADVLGDPSIEYVAWIDADLIWDEPRVLQEGIRQIRDGSAAVQLFSSIAMQDAAGQVESVRASASAGFAATGKHNGSPGGAWLARADLLRHVGGLSPYNVVGGGDQFAFEGFTGCRAECAYRHVSQHLVTIDTEWAMRARRWITARRLRSSFVDATVQHLWNGDRSNRRYDQRRRVLADYDPARDVRINADGILEWTGANPRLERAVAEYFAGRQEDE